MRRKKPLARGKPLARSGRLRRTTRIKANGTRTKKSGGHLFPKGVDEQYRAFIRRRPCILRGKPVPDAELVRLKAFVPPASWGRYEHICDGPVQVCHVKSRGAGGDDHGNVVAMCAQAHEEQHRLGIRSFQRKWGIDLKVLAATYW